MAIAVGGVEERPMSDINTTPLVDVMLVLLIIFLITIPVVTSSIPVQLPREAIEIRETRPEHIVISIDRSGAIYWYDARVSGTQSLIERLEKDGKVSQDESKKITKDIQDMTDAYVKKLDEAFVHKEKEILQV